MPNRKYEKGRRYEYKIVHSERDRGCIAFRSAGSHSPVDVVSIDPINKLIRLIQCKSGGSYTEKEFTKIREANIRLNGMFKVEFVVI